MHPSVMDWAAGRIAEHHLNHPACHVLEVGSYNVNGTVRTFFGNVHSYHGVDIRLGPGVDQVIEAGQPYPFDDGTFDVVISTEMLEHDRAPWVSVREMHRVLRPGGHLLLTARGYDHRGCFPVHDYPHDMWRFSVSGMVDLLDWAGFAPVLAEPDPTDPGVFATAVKP